MDGKIFLTNKIFFNALTTISSNVKAFVKGL